MSDHNKPMTQELKQALANHGHQIYAPIQLADSFRHGWLAREAGFKNFHRSLCKRFGYPHDEQFWWRDLVSLEEHIAAAASKPGRLPAGWRVEIDNLADGDVCAMVVNDKDGCGHAVYASNDAILAAFLVVLASAMKSEQKCEGCNGHGMVGGFSGHPDTGGYDSEPCPFCTKPEQQEAKKECQACKQSGMVHCANPGECGGPWSDPVKPQQSLELNEDEVIDITTILLECHCTFCLIERALKKQIKCDGNHGGPRCADPECWNDDLLSDTELLAAHGGAGNLLGLRRVIDAHEAKRAAAQEVKP